MAAKDNSISGNTHFTQRIQQNSALQLHNSRHITMHSWIIEKQDNFTYGLIQLISDNKYSI